MNQKNRWYQFENCTLACSRIIAFTNLGVCAACLARRRQYRISLFTFEEYKQSDYGGFPVCHPMLWMHWKSRNSFGLSNAIFASTSSKWKSSWRMALFWHIGGESQRQKCKGTWLLLRDLKNNSHAETRPEVHKTMTLNVRLVKFKSGLFFSTLKHDWWLSGGKKQKTKTKH